MMIRRLPKDVVDRIAAGEVVERPAAVVKELIENALDARATHIDVTLENGGLNLIRIADDGIGISQDDLPTAFASHATSKLVDVDDLFHVVSFGFRGEALSSIAAVSRARIVSATEGDGGGYRLDCVAGELGELEPVARPRGTVVEVRDLFHNTPARLNFLGAPRTESARCREVCTALSLVNPGVRFTLQVDGKKRFASTGSADARVRVAEVYGKDFAADLLPVTARVPGIELEGFVTLPGAARPRARAQQLFVNGRLVKDRGVLSAVRVACRDFIPPSLQAAWVLFLTIDPEQVDVNVHPTKAEVRFRDRDTLFRIVRRACRDALLGADLAPRVRAEHIGPLGGGAPPAHSSTSGASPGLPTGTHPGGTPGAADRDAGHPAGAAAGRWPGGEHAPGPRPQPGSGEPVYPGAAGSVAERPASPSQSQGLVGEVRAAARFLQVLDTYLIHDSPEGLVLVDQHALHERVLYARLQDELAAGRLERQGLLVPHTVRLTPELHALALERKDELERCGLEIDDFGQDTLVVRAVPAVLRQEDLDDLVVALIAPPDVHGGVPSGLDRRLFTMACHAAIKAGDPLSEAEATELLKQGAELEHDATCPHGRPTRLVIDRVELERLFKRSGF